MHLILAAKVWHYWISIVLVASAVLGVVALGVGYLVKAYSTRFPKQGAGLRGAGARERSDRLGPGRAGRCTRRRARTLRRLVPLRVAATGLRRAHGRSRGTGGFGPWVAIAQRARPTSGHRPPRVGARQHRVVPAPPAAGNREARTPRERQSAGAGHPHGGGGR